MADVRHRQLNELIELIYDFDEGEHRWGVITELLANSMSADAAVLFRMNHGDAQPVTYGSSFHLDKEATIAYSEHYYKLDDFSNYAMHCDLPAYRQLSMHRTLGARCLSNSEWYTDFYRPLGYEHLGTVLLDDASTTRGRLSFAHMREIGRSDFSATDANLVLEAGKHIERAIALQETLLQQRHTLATVMESFDQLNFGLLLLNGSGRVLEANWPAKKILDRRDAFFLKGNCLAGIDTATNEVLFSLIRTNPEPLGDIETPRIRVARIARRNTGAQYHLAIVHGSRGQVFPGSQAATSILFVFDGATVNQDIHSWAKTLYGLTTAQSDLVASLIKGLTLSEHAERFCITKNTARSTLKSIFLKTATSSQNQLLERLLRSPIGYF